MCRVRGCAGVGEDALWHAWMGRGWGCEGIYPTPEFWIKNTTLPFTSAFWRTEVDANHAMYEYKLLDALLKDVYKTLETKAGMEQPLQGT